MIWAWRGDVTSWIPLVPRLIRGCYPLNLKQLSSILRFSVKFVFIAEASTGRAGPGSSYFQAGPLVFALQCSIQLVPLQSSNSNAYQHTLVLEVVLGRQWHTSILGCHQEPPRLGSRAYYVCPSRAS
eukprot:scaffold167583_cov19-Tisochrysis_lutea.AAC.1